MDLLQVIIPDKRDFFVVLKDKTKIPISNYQKIEIDFCDRKICVNGKIETIKSPQITYWVDMNSESKEKLKKLFKDTDSMTRSIVQTKTSMIQVGYNEYLFKANIITRPDMEKSILLSSKYNAIRIELKLEDTDISLFDDAEVAYERYTSRFELLDL
jgi:hypothetical protein